MGDQEDQKRPDCTSLLLAEWISDSVVGHGCPVLFFKCHHPSPILRFHLKPALLKRSSRDGSTSPEDDFVQGLIRNSLHVVNIYDNQQFELAILNLPFLRSAKREIGMIVVDDIADGYQSAKMDQGGIAFGRFLNNRVAQLLQAISGFKVTLVYAKRATQFVPSRRARQWDPKLTLTVALEWKDGSSSNEITAHMETANQKSSKTIVV